MSETLELSREEIIRLTQMPDSNGYAWRLYLILKEKMDLYTGVVNIKRDILTSQMLSRFKVEQNFDANFLLSLLTKAELISNYLTTPELISVKMPIALTETCLENHARH